MLKALRARTRRKRVAAQLCAILSARAREPAFYRELGVVDSFDGRFDLVALHAWLLLERLRAAGEGALAQALVDVLFVRLDEALREQGAGDIGMSRRMKKMASAFYGRLDSYRKAASERELAQALFRNVYRGDPRCVEDSERLATYVTGARNSLSFFSPGGAEPDFGPVPAAETRHDTSRSPRTPA